MLAASDLASLDLVTCIPLQMMVIRTKMKMVMQKNMDGAFFKYFEKGNMFFIFFENIPPPPPGAAAP